MADQAASTLEERGVISGLHTADTLTIGGERIAVTPVALLQGGRCLNGDRSVAAIVLGCIGGEIVASGLPVPRIDTLVLTGETPLASTGDPLPYGQIVALCATLLPHCRSVLTLDDRQIAPDLARALQAVGARPRRLSAEALDSALVRLAGDLAVTDA